MSRLHPHDHSHLGELLQHGEFMVATDAETLMSWIDELCLPVTSTPAAKEITITHAVLITEANCEQLTGQDFRWAVDTAKRMGVAVQNPSGRKRAIVLEDFLAALRTTTKPSSEQTADDVAASIRAMLGREKRGNDAA